MKRLCKSFFYICFISLFFPCYKLYSFGFEGYWYYEDNQDDFELDQMKGVPYIFLMQNKEYSDGEIRLSGDVAKNNIIYIVEVGTQNTEHTYTRVFVFKGKYAKERAEKWYSSALTKINHYGNLKLFVDYLDTKYNWSSISTGISSESKVIKLDYEDKENLDL